MDPITAFWHVANFFAPAVGVGAIAAALVKLIWRRELQGQPWWRLWAAAAVAGAAAAVAALLAFGRDGTMASYAALVGAVALGLWLAAFGPARR